MTEEEFAALVQRLEPKARADPKGYARRVAALGAVGYVVIGVALLVLVGLGALVVHLAINHTLLLAKLLFPLAALALVIVRSLPVEFEPPAGVGLRREDVPELFRMIEDVNEKVRGPKVHEVLLDDDLNASVVQIPRRGGVFGSRNYLVLGLQYFQALTAEEFRAVIAHELGHLSKSHGRVGAWIYRIRATWSQLLENLEEKRHWTTGLFRRFFEWYVPYFDAYSLPLRRAHEFEADAAAAEAAGAQTTARWLVTATLAGRYVTSDYWPRVHALARDEPQPPRHAFAPLRQELGALGAHPDRRNWLEEALREEVRLDDSHPSLADRLHHLGVDPLEILAANGAGESERTSAAETYLGTAEARLTEEVEQRWQQDMLRAWRAAHHETQQAKATLQRLERRAQVGELSLEEERERAELTSTLRDEDEALPLWEDLLARDPDDGQAAFAIAVVWRERGDDRALEYFDCVIERDPERAAAAAALASDYLASRGREQEAGRYRERAEAEVDLLVAASEERESLTLEDELEPHGLPDELVARVRRRLAAHDEVGKAYLARKRVRHLADTRPLYVVAACPRGGLRQAWREVQDEYEPLHERLAREIDLPGEVLALVVPAGGDFDRRLAAVPGAKLFER